MKIAVCVAGLLVLAAVGTDFPAGWACAQSPKDPLAQLLSCVDQQNKGLRDFSARVRQQKFFADLGDEVTFQGSVAYARPHQMLWKFTQPDPSSLLLNSAGAWLIVPGIKQIQKVEASGSSDVHDRINALFLGFEKPLSEMAKSCPMEWAGEDMLPQGPAQRVKLFRPQDPHASEVTIWFDRLRFFPLRVRWATAQGDITTNDFFDIQINRGIDRHIFELVIPPGYEIIGQSSPATVQEHKVRG